MALIEFLKSFIEFHKSFMEFHKIIYGIPKMIFWNSINDLRNYIIAYFRALRLAIQP